MRNEAIIETLKMFRSLKLEVEIVESRSGKHKGRIQVILQFVTSLERKNGTLVTIIMKNIKSVRIANSKYRNSGLFKLVGLCDT